MEKLKKILVAKDEEASAVAEKVIDADAETVVISLPKGADFSRSLANFRLLKREADLMEKKVVIESIDEAALERAKKVGLDCVDPFFGKNQKKKFSDITVTAKQDMTDASAQPVPIVIAKTPGETKDRMTEVIKPTVPVRQSVSTPKIFTKRNAFIVAGLAVVAAALYVGLVLLPKADVTITMKKESWSYKNPIVVDKNIAAIDPAGARVPGQVFTQKTNASIQFTASGKKTIERKATGQIVIYNALSSKPQPLVASTRFQTPDGKVFRLTTSVTVPGADIADGKIVASSVVAPIIADQVGAQYNVGPIAKLTIPGFAGTPKFDAFYGELKEPTKDGFSGEIRVATDADIKTAKVTAAQTVESSVRGLLASQMPAQFKVLDGTANFVILKQSVNPEADSSGKFTVLTEGQASQIAFAEKDIFAMLAERIKSEKGADYQITNKSFSYGSSTAVDAGAGKMSVAIDYRAELSKTVDLKSLTERIKGQSEAQLKVILTAVPGVDTISVAFWPVWVRSVPSNTARVSLTVQ